MYLHQSSLKLNQYSQEGRPKPGPRGPERGTVPRVQPNEIQKPPGKYTFQTNQLPRPQYPAVKNIDAKAAKQVRHVTMTLSAILDNPLSQMTLHLIKQSPTIEI